MRIGHSSGGVFWTKTLDGGAQDVVSELSLDVTNNRIHLSGATNGAIASSVQAYGKLDGFVSSFDMQGHPKSHVQFGGSKEDGIAAAALDEKTSNLFVGGAAGSSFDGQSLQGMTDLYVKRVY